MDSSKKFVKPSPEDKANVLSRLFFCWTLPFFRFGYRNHLKIKDIYNTTEIDASGSLGDELESNWNKQIKYANQHDGARPSLQTAIFKTFYKRYSLMGFLLVLECLVIRLLQPIILAKYIRYYKDPPENRDENEGWTLGTTVIVLPFLHTILAHFTEMTLQRMGMRVRIACCSLIYRKLLKLSQSSLGQTAAGQLVNLLSNDVQRFDIAALYLHYIWIMPLYFIFAYYVMYTSVGVAATSGMLTIAIQGIFLQGHLSRLQGYFRFKIALRTDHRIKLMSEITAGIQAIKLYAWEKPFQKVVELARKLEIDVITKTSYIKGISTGMMVFTERFILYLTLITYVLLGNNLTGDIIFSLAQLFNQVQNYVAFLFPNAIATYSEARVSIGRIEKFLLMEENTRKFEDDKVIQRTGSVELIHAKACWVADVLALKNLSLTVNPGTLCCVVGSIGAGKSSLLQVLIQELPLKEGKVKIAGKVSYASQEPWLFVSSVRNNILFGRDYNKNRYRGVVAACSLEADFEQFPYGDKTLVGERGAILSGGQKARISLARAVYSEADIYLFDDPLSAVDTHVARHLFEECIVRYLDGKTRVVVTHQLQFLKQADLVVVLDEGRIVEVGKFEELSTNRLKALKEQSQVESEDAHIKKIRKRTLSIISSASTINEDAAAEDDELIEKGAIPTSTYVEYCRAGTSLKVLFSLLFLLVVAQLASNACDFWLRHWANVEEIRQNESYEISVNLTDESEFITDEPIYDTEYSSIDFEQQKLYIIVYTTFIIASIVLTSARSILYYKVCMNTSKALHNKMFACILQAPKRFFDVNPSGRILNRFSKDMGAIDELLPAAALDGIQIFLVLTGILMSVFIVSPYMIIPAVVLGLVFHWCKTVYLSTAQDVKRLEGVTRAPVFSHTSATLQGLATIRSSRAEELLITEFDTLQDRHTSTWFLFLATSEAFGFYLDIICTIFLGLVTYQFMIFSGDSPSGNVGLVISQSLVLTGMLQYGVRQSAAVASNMVSVERVLQYTKLDKEESSGDFVRKVVLDGWPNYGRITFKSVNLRYVPEQLPVLKDLNIEIRPKEKIGIVGRTGAGKSSLIASLFRLAPLEGTITIDEVDTATVHLQCLRSKISIIPQDPILFSAPVRYNLDPFADHADEVLWKALENVELKSAIKDLNQEVSEGGANFSAGQKQLMCLARAIVRNNKILVMDEATANVDSDTDALIQKTIREKFKECTVLTIAHRLNTIMDSDRVLVMDYGQAVEFDHPHVLLQKEDGHFAKMVGETGVNMQKVLRNIAKDDHEKRYGTNL